MDILFFDGEKINTVGEVPNTNCACIWDTQNNRIIVGPKEYEKSFGPSGTHYQMRTLNFEYAQQFGIGDLDDFVYSDHVNDCVDFDIVIRGKQKVATLPHTIAKSIPGVVGIDKAAISENWFEVFGDSSTMLINLRHIKNEEGVPVFSNIERSLRLQAKALENDLSKLVEDLFSAISEKDALPVSVIETEFGKKIALSHADAGYTGIEKCSDGILEIFWDRRPGLKFKENK